ncbi:MAG TPA: histidine kinase dimerization/phospho-acceptor domain-containing protein [Steroidobacteraceae bacterium]|nr:histidine kinase dimerization/phospho-acceptor domain-containing protein [Steroidobacteraceae bacterium]
MSSSAPTNPELGVIAHDFNNVLTIIAGYSDLLLAALGTDHGARAYANEIAVATKRARAINRRLLEMAGHPDT